MISVLIIDDSSEKVAAIRQVLYEYPEVKSKIEVASDANNGRRLLEKSKYDLLILDLVLPNDFGDEARPENGIEFLNEISDDPNKKCPFHVLGITAQTEFIPEYASSFKKHLWYLINYQAGVEEWREVLRNKIEYLINSKKELQISETSDYDFDVAIITALGKELKKVLQLEGNWKEIHVAGDATIYNVGQFTTANGSIRVVAATTPQMGMCASSTLSMKLIHHFRPRYLIMAGIAAGVQGEVHLGDILIADEIWDAGSGKVKMDKSKGRLFLPDPKHKTLDEDIKELMLGLKQKRKYVDSIRNNYPAEAPSTVLNIHIGPMASVPAVVQSNQEIEEIKSHNRKLIGIEMEAYGMFYGAANAQKPKPKAISVKSVCDFANEEKGDSLQDYASYTSAAFVYQLITNELPMA